jgi:hypothetical protein
MLIAAVHVWSFVRRGAAITGDSVGYIERAELLRARHTFLAHDLVAYAVAPGSFPIGPVMPDTLRTPVYPAFIALVHDLRAIVVLQHAIVLALAYGIYRWVGREVSAAAGIAAAAIFALHPFVLQSANVVMTEILAAALVACAAAALLAALRGRGAPTAIASGILFGLATLTRPIALYLPIVLVLFLYRKGRGAVLLAFALASIVLPAAWAWRNYRATGVVTVSSIEGENLLSYRAVGALVVKDARPLDALLALQENAGFYAPAARLRMPLLRAALREAPNAANHAQRARSYARLARRILLQHPLAYAEVAVSSVIALLVDNFSSVAAERGMPIIDARIRFIPLSLLLLVLAIRGVAMLSKSNGDAGVTVTIILVYFVVLSAGPEVAARFSVPFMPEFAVAIAVGATRLRSECGTG